MKLQVSTALEWEQIEEAASAVTTCIRPGVDEKPSGPNWLKAKRTWETFGVDEPRLVRYFRIHGPSEIIGYMRLFQVDSGVDKRCAMWLVDYANPFSYTAVGLVAEMLGGTVLVKEVPSAEDKVLTKTWKMVRVTFPAMTKFLYAVQRPDEGTWLVVP